MITKCANPACSVPFHYMREGRLFRMEFDPDPHGIGPALVGSLKPPRRIEHFWLCGACSGTLTLVMKDGKVQTARLDRVTCKAGAASYIIPHPQTLADESRKSVLITPRRPSWRLLPGTFP